MADEEPTEVAAAAAAEEEAEAAEEAQAEEAPAEEEEAAAEPAEETEEAPEPSEEPQEAEEPAQGEEPADGGETPAGDDAERPEGTPQERTATPRDNEEKTEGEGAVGDGEAKQDDEDAEKPPEEEDGSKKGEEDKEKSPEEGEEGGTPRADGETTEATGEGEGEKHEGEHTQEEEKAEEEAVEREITAADHDTPVPQSDTFADGDRLESPVAVGERLSREGSVEYPSQSVPLDYITPGTPEKAMSDVAETETQSHPDVYADGHDPEFDREVLIEKYHAALSEREAQQQQNFQLQNKLAEYFRKKKADERQDYDKNVADQEQRYLKYMAQLEDLHQQDAQERENYHLQIVELKDKCEDKKSKVDNERGIFLDFMKQVALNAINSRSGKGISQRDIEQYISNENKKEGEVVNVRLENIKLKNKLKKKEQQLKSKEELAEGLHLIDFEQLKIENQTYNEKIEERNEELLKLRKKITSTVQVLTHLKEKLQFVQAENQVQKTHLRDVEALVAQKRDILSRTKQARDSLRIDNQKLRQNCGLLGNELLLRDFEEQKDESDELREKLERLRAQHAELTLNCNQVRRKLEQARAGRS